MVSLGDLVGISNVGNLQFTNDTAVAQTNTLTLDTATVDRMVNDGRTAATGFIETLNVTALDNANVPAATTNLVMDASLANTANTQLSVLLGRGTDNVITGAGADNVTMVGNFNAGVYNQVVNQIAINGLANGVVGQLIANDVIKKLRADLKTATDDLEAAVAHAVVDEGPKNVIDAAATGMSDQSRNTRSGGLPKSPLTTFAASVGAIGAASACSVASACCCAESFSCSLLTTSAGALSTNDLLFSLPWMRDMSCSSLPISLPRRLASTSLSMSPAMGTIISRSPARAVAAAGASCPSASQLMS